MDSADKYLKAAVISMFKDFKEKNIGIVKV